jgi:hypothetical protein
LVVPSLFQRIIDLPDSPKPRKAKVIGYSIAKWGDYPALIKGYPNQEVYGYAYIVQSEEEATILAGHATRAFEASRC